MPKVLYSAKIEVRDDDPTSEKPYIVIDFGDGSEPKAISSNLAEIIGKTGAGAREVYENRRRFR